MIDLYRDQLRGLGPIGSRKAAKEARARAAAAHGDLGRAFGRGHSVDFGAKQARTKAEPLPRAAWGELTALQLTTEPVDKLAVQFDALPEPVRRAADKRNVSRSTVSESGLLALRVAAIAHGAGAPLRLARSDIAARLGVTVERADAAVSDAVQAGLIVEHHSYSPATRTIVATL